MTKFAVIEFPGSNCDHDAYYAVKHVLGHDAEFIWHKDTDLRGAEVVVLPGGFSYGDYLRTGAIARFSPVMSRVRAFADAGGPVIGICNGFQVLLEAGLLEGALLRNRRLKFLCQQVHVRVEQVDTSFTGEALRGQILKLPIAHGEGNYYSAPDTLGSLEANRQVVFRYCDAAGERSDPANPNGSINAIAGVCNRRRNVVGLMPHPERACESALGSEDGRVVLESVVAAVLSQGVT